jgi:phosphatidylinositol-3-phosphatase
MRLRASGSMPRIARSAAKLLTKDEVLMCQTLPQRSMARTKAFIGYVETGSPREHNPWESFSNARRVERNLSELPNDSQLPTVAFIIPNLNHDMHGRGWRGWLKDHLHAIIPGLNPAMDEALVRDGDTWLKDHLSSYAEWAKVHNSLLIVTFDEDDDHAGNHIPTLIFGAHVRAGRYAERTTHYNVFSTLLAMYNLPPFATAVTSLPIYSIWEQ